MATISIDNFGGIAPRLHPTLLGANMATRAHNCILKSGKLVPIKQPSQTAMPIMMMNGLTKIGDAKTIHIWHMADGKKRVLAWPGKVYVTESNFSTDPNRRLFLSGDTGVGGSGEDGNRPAAIFDLGDGRYDIHDMTKEPLAAPVVGDWDDAQSRIVPHTPAIYASRKYTYFYQAWVDKYGYESGLSEPSEEVTYNSGDTISIGGIARAPEGCVARRIYVAAAGTSGDYILFAQQQSKLEDIASFSRMTVEMLDENFGEQEPAIESPHEDLEMIVKLPGNFYAGVRRSNRREIRFSEIGNPSNWPDEYTTAITDDIVGLGVTLNTVFAITKSYPWAVTGTAPEAMTPSKLASDLGCVSAGSICAWNGRVFYAGHTGIVMLADGTATAGVVTESAFSKREWQSLNPGLCRMCAYDNAIYSFFESGNSLVCAIGSADSADAAVTTCDEAASCVCFDRDEDRMYFVRGTNG